MPSRRSLLGALPLFLLTPTAPATRRRDLSLPTRSGVPGAHRGVNLAHLHRRGLGYGSAASRAQLVRLRSLGVTHIALNPFGYTPAVDSPEIRFGSSLDRSLTDDDLLAEAAQIQQLGMKVCLKPHLWCPAFGRGQSPQDLRPPDWGAWFAQYERFALHHARLAQQMGAALYVIGLECLQATRDNPGAWGQIADRCRAVFGGPLSYAANWWQEVDAFSDWHAFDAVGVSAYYPLDTGPGPDPSAQDLADAWRPHLDHLAALSARVQRPVLFLEAGCRATRGAAAQPWDHSRQAEPDPLLQARYYEALLSVAADRPWLQGIYWWKWFTDHDQREPDDYAPMGMPAEEILRRWWASPP